MHLEAGWAPEAAVARQREAEARHCLWRALYRQIGARASLMEHPDGESFAARAAFGDGVAHTPHRLLGVLPDGDVASHEADLAVGWEGGAWLYVDFLLESEGRETLKALAYDALHLRDRPGCQPVLVFLVQGGRLSREEVDALAYPYGLVYAIRADEAQDPQSYAALVAHVTSWLAAQAP